jgi:hypothetical protein
MSGKIIGSDQFSLMRTMRDAVSGKPVDGSKPADFKFFFEKPFQDASLFSRWFSEVEAALGVKIEFVSAGKPHAHEAQSIQNAAFQVNVKFPEGGVRISRCEEVMKNISDSWTEGPKDQVSLIGISDTIVSKNIRQIGAEEFVDHTVQYNPGNFQGPVSATERQSIVNRIAPQINMFLHRFDPVKDRNVHDKLKGALEALQRGVEASRNSEDFRFASREDLDKFREAVRWVNELREDAQHLSMNLKLNGKWLYGEEELSTDHVIANGPKGHDPAP